MRASWITGLIAGPIAALALLVLPTPGLVLSVVVALFLLKARGLPALAGMLCGTGASGLALVAQANARCAASTTGCFAPNGTATVLIAAALLTIGAAMTLTLYVQGRRRRATI